MREQTKEWTTREGKKIRICDMEDSHLLNTLKMLYRYGCRKQQATLDTFQHPFMPPQGDIAQMVFESEFEYVLESDWTEYVPLIFDSLVLEAWRRDLDIPEPIKAYGVGGGC